MQLLSCSSTFFFIPKTIHFFSQLLYVFQKRSYSEDYEKKFTGQINNLQRFRLSMRLYAEKKL